MGNEAKGLGDHGVRATCGPRLGCNLGSCGGICPGEPHLRIKEKQAKLLSRQAKMRVYWHPSQPESQNANSEEGYSSQSAGWGLLQDMGTGGYGPSSCPGPPPSCLLSQSPPFGLRLPPGVHLAI